MLIYNTREEVSFSITILFFHFYFLHRSSLENLQPTTYLFHTFYLQLKKNRCVGYNNDLLLIELNREEIKEKKQIQMKEQIL